MAPSVAALRTIARFDEITSGVMFEILRDIYCYVVHIDDVNQKMSEYEKTGGLKSKRERVILGAAGRDSISNRSFLLTAIFLMWRSCILPRAPWRAVPIFVLPERSFLTSVRPVISVCAVRTGCGKDSVIRRIAALLREHNLRPVVVRHPMPYGDLSAQAVQRFAAIEGCDRHHCTIEEREEYEQHINNG